MNYPTHDTEWATARSGNIWKRTNGIPMIVGKRKDGRWWARRGDYFIKGSFTSKIEAMNAAELGNEGEADSVFKDVDWGGKP